MSYACTYCGYGCLTIVRDYTGAPYGLCQRCYRRDPFYRFKPVGQPIEKTAADSPLPAAPPDGAVGDPVPT